jgi:hypothetical protein
VYMHAMKIATDITVTQLKMDGNQNGHAFLIDTNFALVEADK